MRRFVCVLIVLFAGCCTVETVDDFPQLPLPAETKLEAVAGKKAEDGILLSEDEFRKTVRMIQEMKGEIEILRKIISTYNEWADKKKGKDSE